MADQKSAEERLAKLRELILDARSMPMSASCVINRNEVLAAIDEVVQALPDEFAEAQRVIDEAQAKVAEGEAEADRIINEARTKVSQLAEDSEVVAAAEALAAKLKAEAETEAMALRRETDVFIDARMASFESVLHKTSSQVKTARLRLSERSSLDGDS
jgi:regulator of protease activity HflC (stomatin/prohibitin superfamily)